MCETAQDVLRTHFAQLNPCISKPQDSLSGCISFIRWRKIVKTLQYTVYVLEKWQRIRYINCIYILFSASLVISYPGVHMTEMAPLGPLLSQSAVSSAMRSVLARQAALQPTLLSHHHVGLLETAYTRNKFANVCADCQNIRGIHTDSSNPVQVCSMHASMASIVGPRWLFAWRWMLIGDAHLVRRTCSDNTQTLCAVLHTAPARHNLHVHTPPPCLPHMHAHPCSACTLMEWHRCTRAMPPNVQPGITRSGPAGRTRCHTTIHNHPQPPSTTIHNHPQPSTCVCASQGLVLQAGHGATQPSTCVCACQQVLKAWAAWRRTCRGSSTR